MSLSNYDEDQVLSLMRPPGTSLVTGLQELIKDFIDEDTVMAEIGCFAGASSRMFYEKLGPKGQLICVDQWKAYCKEMEDWKVEWAEECFMTFFEERQNVTIFKGPSVEMADRVLDESLDFCYIDADHTYDSVVADILAWLPKVKKGKFIGGHDHGNFAGVDKAVQEYFPQVRLYQDSSWVAEVK